jgi:hypothetical protein
MAYSTKFYCNIKDFSGNTFQVQLLQNGFTGSSQQIRRYAASTPLTINVRGGRESDDQILFPTDISFSFCVEATDIYDELLTSNYKDYKLKVLLNGSDYFTGWVDPQNITKRYVAGNYLLNVTANDGLLDLKNVEYPIDYATGYTSIKTIIKRCLSELNIELDVASQVGIVHNGTLNFIECFANQKRFIEDRDGRITTMSCYDALEAILKPFKVKVAQVGNRWTITSRNEIDSELHLYDWTSLTASTSSYNRILDQTFRPLKDSDELSMIKPLLKFNTTFRNVNAGDTIFNNGTFDTDISGWSNGGGSEAFYLFQHDASQRLRCTVPSPLGNPNVEKYFYSDAFSITSLSENDTITFSLDVDLQVTITGGTGSFPPILKLVLIYPDANEVEYSFSNMVEGLKTYETAFGLDNQSGNFILEVHIVPSSYSTYSSYNIYFDNVTGIPVYEDEIITTDKFYSGSVSSSTAIGSDDDELLFGDGTQQSDLGNLKYSTTGLTTTWSNYDGLVNLSLQNLFIQNTLQLNNKFKKYLRIALKNNNTIVFNKAIEIDGIPFEVMGLSIDAMRDVATLDLIEILQNSITVSFASVTLNSVDGEDANSSSSTVTLPSTGGGLTGSLTPPRVPFSVGSDTLSDNAQLRFSGTSLLVGTSTYDANINGLKDEKLYVSRDISTSSAGITCGTKINAQQTAATAGITSALCVNAIPAHSSGTIVNVTGIRAYIQGTNTSTVTEGVGAQVGLIHAGSGTITNQYDIYSQTVLTSSGNLTNYYQLYLAASAAVGAGTITNKYGMYQADSAALNYFNGFVGIQNNAPTAPLHFSNSVYQKKICLRETATNDFFQFFGFGGNTGFLRYQIAGTSDSHRFYAGTSSSTDVELMRITGAGNVGIGVTPNAPLQFARVTASRKIVMYEGTNNDHQFYGFGVDASTLRYQVSDTSADHIWYAGTSSSASNELFRVKGTGKLILPTAPSNDNALTQVLVRDGSTGEVKYKDNIISGSLTSGRVTLSNGTSSVTDSANLLFDSTNGVVSTKGTSPGYDIYLSTTRYGLIRIANATNNVITGSVTNDLTVRTETTNILFSANAGSTIGLKINTSNKLLLPVAPSNDDTLTQLIARDGSTGELKYRNASTLLPAGSTNEVQVKSSTGVLAASGIIANSSTGVITLNSPYEIINVSTGLAFIATGSGGNFLLDSPDLRIRFATHSTASTPNQGFGMYGVQRSSSYDEEMFILAPGGDASINANGMDLTLYGGNGATATNGAGGDIMLVPGTGVGSGKDGNIAMFGQPSSWNSAEGVIYIKNNTVSPTAAATSGIFIYSDVISGALNSSLGIRTEQAVEAGAPTFSHKVKIIWNNVEYWLGLDQV